MKKNICKKLNQFSFTFIPMTTSISACLLNLQKKKKKTMRLNLKKKIWRPKKNKTVFFIFSYSDFKNDMGIFVSNNNYFFWVVGYQPEPHERKIEGKKKK